MAIQNRIVKVQKRNRALVRFDQSRITRALAHAAESVGGFQTDFLPGVNDRFFESAGGEAGIAEALSDTVVICLNSDPHHLISNFPPTIEAIQDQVLHVLRSHGFQTTADAYACYRWGRHWLREGAISPEQFAGNGLGNAASEAEGGRIGLPELNELVRSGRIGGLAGESIARYERRLDEAAGQILSRLNSGRRIRMMWVTGPSASGKTTTTLKLTRRLEQHGLRFLVLNLDDYFWSLVEHPTDWINDRNYEAPEALDIQLLNQHLRELLAGRAVDKPVYSFKEGRCIGTKTVRLEADQMLLLDCLHGLYPPIAEGIEPSAQFRVYAEAQNMVCDGDGKGAVPARFADVCLMRRILRDARHRNHGPLRTMLHWHYVRDGELFSILPLRGLADFVVNCGFPFDLPALKPFLVGSAGILPGPEAFQSYPGFLDARIRYERIKGLLEGVAGFSEQQLATHALIPGDALIREFIGGGTLQIPHND